LRILLVTSNGWGLGHLTRQLAIALAIGDRAETTMFSLSPGFPLAMDFGVKGEYCPSFTTQFIVRKEWDNYLQDRLAAFAVEVQPDVMLFDGVAPYSGFMRAIAQLPDCVVGWLRRGMWREGSNEHQLQKTAGFDFVIEPTDLASDIDTGATIGAQALRVPPISLLEVMDQLDRETAARELGIEPDRPTLLLTLGSGRLGDVAGPGSTALDVVLGDTDWQVAVTNSPVAVNLVPLVDDSRVIEIKGVYPLLRYFNAFDATVSAAGYNSVHELVPAGVPTLLIPNTSSKTDNQEGRARYLADLGVALSARDDDLPAVARETARLLDPAVRAELIDNHRASGVANRVGGAKAVASELLKPPQLSGRERAQTHWDAPISSRIAGAVLGERGKATVKRLLGRTVPDYTTERRRVRLSGPPAPAEDGILSLVITSERDRIDPRAAYPIEHVLQGSSPGYRQRRMEIVEKYYEVVPPDSAVSP
jgi:UDP:flavonoid glycosyltransferase YjiC (YdhE family)